MIVADIVLAFCVAILFAVFVKQCVRIERCEDNMGMSEAEIQELRRRCDAYKELIEALSKSVRELNGVVEEAVKVKEETSDNKPDTKALMGGWSVGDVRTEIDASHISAGMIDGKSLMNCELPNLSESAREKIFELLGVKVPEEEKPADTYYLGVGVDDDKMLRIPVRDTGQTLVDGEPIRHGRLWTNSEGRIYELPEGCFILGDTPYEMD